ncbi:MAG: hypothetical protein WA268_14860 [Xanthobacteraceae bacterium]
MRALRGFALPSMRLRGRTNRLGFGFTLAAIALLAAMLPSGLARAQAPRAVLQSGDAVVTGFSGAPQPAQVTQGVDPGDQTFIDPNGPSVRVFNLQAPGAPPQAQILATLNPFTVTAGQVGQVFGVALDNANPPNIYVAATSAYGLPIVAQGQSGALVRIHQGGIGAAFMAGLFGPDAQGGGPGSIWRIDGASGAVSLFANVALNGVANNGPALGGLAFDPSSSTLFVADRQTGMIHRFNLSGQEVALYDHGVQGRQAAGLAPVAYDPSQAVPISSPQFSGDKPATWGYAAPGRRLFGLAVHNGRLYYAVADQLQIWSVGINPDGSFGVDARMELQAPPAAGPTEISKIVFDGKGNMLLAERAAPTGDYELVALAQAGIGRVLRYAPVPAAPGMPPGWQAVPDQYAIGFPGAMANSNGGIAIGYAYSTNGQINRSACGGFLWSTGEDMRESQDANLAKLLAASGTPYLNGLQGNGIDLVAPANVPPMQTYFADYNVQYDSPAIRGYMGDIAIPMACSQAAQPFVPPLVCPPGSWFNAGTNACIVIPPACPAGRITISGQCCPPGELPQLNGSCRPPYHPPIPPPNRCGRDYVQLPNGACCLREQTTAGGACCPYGEYPGVDGACHSVPPSCRPGELYDRLLHRCIVPECPAGMRRNREGFCACPGGDRFDYDSGRCVAQCPRGEELNPFTNRCSRPVVCQRGSAINAQGICVPVAPCPAGQMPVGQNGACVPILPACPPNQVRNANGICSPVRPPECAAGQVRNPAGFCVPASCPAGHLRNASGACVAPVPSCPPGQVRNASGACMAPLTPCPAGQSRVNGKCLAQPCAQGQVRNAAGACVRPAPLPACPAGQARNAAGACVANPPERPVPPPACPPGQVRNAAGACVANPPERPVPPLACPPGQVRNAAGACVANPPQRPVPPLACPAGQVRNAAGACVANPPQRPVPPPACPLGQVRNAAGACVANPPERPVPPLGCPAGQVRNAAGACVANPPQRPVPPPACPPGQVRNAAGACVRNPPERPVPPPACPPGQVRNAAGACVANPPQRPVPPPACPAGEVRNAAGACVKPVQPPRPAVQPARPEPPKPAPVKPEPPKPAPAKPAPAKPALAKPAPDKPEPPKPAPAKPEPPKPAPAKPAPAKPAPPKPALAKPAPDKPAPRKPAPARPAPAKPAPPKPAPAKPAPAKPEPKPAPPKPQPGCPAGEHLVNGKCVK